MNLLPIQVGEEIVNYGTAGIARKHYFREKAVLCTVEVKWNENEGEFVRMDI